MSSEKRQCITTQHRRNKMREYLTRKIYGGVVFALAIFGTTILAVAISGTIKTWTTGEVLKSADLNTTIASLQTAIQNIPNWTKAANGNDAYYTAGNVGIGTASPITPLQVIEAYHGYSARFGGSVTPSFMVAGFDALNVGNTAIGSGTDSSRLSLNTGMTISGGSRGTERISILNSNGYVGIGTSSPTQTLHLHNASQPVLKLTSASGDFQLGSNDFNTWMASITNPMEFFVGGSERMRITSTGLVGIGRTPTTHPLEVQGTAGLTTGTAWTNISDERLKNIDGTISSALDNLLKLNPIKYKYNEASGKLFKNADGKSKYGFTAQNVKSVFPEMVITDDKGYLWYNPSGFEAILTSAIKEVAFRLRSTSDSVSVVTQKIDSLEKEKAANEKKLLALEEDNKRLREDMARLRGTLEDRLRAIENTQMARK